MGSLRVCIQRGIAFTNPLVEGLGCEEFEIDRAPMSTKVDHSENGEDEADEDDRDCQNPATTVRG
jgi:hypothetical protein